MGYGVPDSGVDFFYITVQGAYALMKSDMAVFVDSRDTKDYRGSRLQTSWNIPVHEMLFDPELAGRGTVEHLLALAAAGKTIVCVSDTCITGNKNRGHVSRCRHAAQYLVEHGCDRASIVRMTGGLNAWKISELDGVLGDLRCMYSGRFIDRERHPESAEAADPGRAGSDEEGSPAHPTGHMIAEGEELPSDIVVVVGGNTATGEAETRLMKMVPPRPFKPDTPTAYRTLRTELYKRPSKEPDKIIKLERRISSTVRTTGEVWQSPNGGSWAELDAAAGEKKGWVYIEGPGFGPSSRKIRTEFLRA